MREYSATIITISIIVLIVGGLSVYTFRDGLSGDGGNSSPDITQLQGDGETPYTDLQDEPVDLDDYTGMVLVVNSWASWCPFCVEELSDLNTLAEQYKDKDVAVIAINRKENRATARAFVDHIGSPEHIVFLLDPEDRFYESIGGFAMPETVFYNTEGDIVFHKRGSMELEEMRRHLDAARNGSRE